MKSSKSRENKHRRKGMEKPKAFIWGGCLIQKSAPSGFGANKARMLGSTALPASAEARFNPSRVSSALTERYYPKNLGLAGKLGTEKRELVDWLRKKYADDQASMALAEKLEGCERDQRCRSLACPKCSNAAQAFITEVVGTFLAAQQDQTKVLVVVSVVPADGAIAKGQLSADQHQRNERRWKEAFRRAGVTWFVGATDWSFNEHIDNRYQPRWQPHFYGFTVTDDIERLKKKLRKQFPSTDAIPRPVKVEAWDGDSTAIDYMLKPDFWRRIGTDDGQRRGHDAMESGSAAPPTNNR
jgi:hypothetical protein